MDLLLEVYNMEAGHGLIEFIFFLCNGPNMHAGSTVWLFSLKPLSMVNIKFFYVNHDHLKEPKID